MSVRTQIDGNCLIITIAKPPVNALGQSVRAGLVEAFKKLEQDSNIQAVVLTGEGRFFSAGADIKEFGKGPLLPSLPDTLNVIDNCRLPVVAALPGAALGGGLETALACRYRLAARRASAGLPEVNLGLIPGAGGTQRLPRLIGMKAAAEFVISGKAVGAEKALSLGLIDEIVDTDLLPRAINFARSLIGQDLRIPVSQMSAPDDWSPEAYDALMAKTKAKARGQLSPIAALKAVKAACTMAFSEGLEIEREIFLDCLSNPQREGLIHGFFAQRQAKKIPDIDGVEPLSVRSIGILGAGTMGAGIAIACLTSGFDVKLFDVQPAALEKGVQRIKASLDGNVKSRRMSAEQAVAAMSRLTAIEDMSELEDIDLVIEAIVEKMDVKKAVFKQLDKICKADTILASNTSYLDINEIASVTQRPEKTIGLHFFSPANIMKLLEVIKTDKASPQSLATAFAVGAKLGKVSVLSGVCDGFIGNRILKSYRAEAEFLLEDGALPQDIDRVMREFGFAMGPFQVSDLAGLDIAWHNRRKEDDTRDPNTRYVVIADQLYDLGRLGQKTGAGWYDYKAGERGPHISPLVDNLVIQASKDKNIIRRDISDEEILNRIINVMAAEGQAILTEGIALKASDIDLVMIHGYGFPKYRGGLMFYAAANGLPA